MPLTCSVAGCKNKFDKTNPKLSLFRFPRNEVYCKQWLNVCKRKNINVKNARICSTHFRDEFYKPLSFTDKSLQTRRLFDYAIPTENLLINISQKNEIELSRNSKINKSLPLDNNDFFDSFQKAVNDVVHEFRNAENCENISKKLNLLNKEFDQNDVDNSEINNLTISEMLFSQLEESRGQLKKMKEKLEKVEDKLMKTEKKLENAEEKLLKAEEKIKNLEREKEDDDDEIEKLPNLDEEIKNWISDDAIGTISLQTHVAKSNNEYLRNVLKISLPGLASLKRWVQKFDVSPRMN
ncbi:THAP domain-containing protein 1-like [Leptopilina boulardi]|uniref:THAP domain-containing protein 1-like n=1 Tax=Leptopilina boulardi TaxID=63433 RepID=UPI0021F54261|nr:THAP domain-containing protein 1-like [Leptopilina boulardi]